MKTIILTLLGTLVISVMIIITVKQHQSDDMVPINSPLDEYERIHRDTKDSLEQVRMDSINAVLYQLNGLKK